MRRSIFLSLLLLAGCAFDPPGDCRSDAQCAAGLRCSAGVCSVDAVCKSSGDCRSFETCGSGATCSALAGRCNLAADCSTGQTCDNANTCVATPGKCSSGADCTSFETCGASSACALKAGRCISSSDCPASQTCGTTNTCVTKQGTCATQADCKSFESCGADHACALLGERCLIVNDCQSFELCDVPTNTCHPAAGSCNTPNDCAPFSDCIANRCSLQSGRCNLPADCPGLIQTCDTSANRCIIAGNGSQGGDVFLQGRVNPNFGIGVARLSSPSTPQVGFDIFTGTMFLRGDGAILYSLLVIGPNSNSTQLRQFAADSFLINSFGDFIYPSNTEANDPIVATPPCFNPAFILQGAGGPKQSLAYGCPDNFSIYSYVDVATGLPLFTSDGALDAWNGDGARYLRDTNQVFDPAGVAHTITGLPTTGGFAFSAGPRTHPGGFWVVFFSSADGSRTLYDVDNTGHGTVVSTYSAGPTGINYSHQGVIDSAGNFYEQGTGVIVLFNLQAQTASIVYSDQADTPSFPNFLHNAIVRTQP